MLVDLPARRMLMTLALCFAGGCDGQAADRKANPNTLQDVLLAARGGEKVVLAPGQYGDLTLSRQNYRPQVVVDATQAKFTGITLRNVNGLAIEGGVLDGPREQTFGLLIDSSQNVAVRRMLFTGVRVGVSVSRSQDVVIEQNRFDGVRSDGVNIAGSQRVQILNNQCLNFRPIYAVFDAAGKLVKDGDHPDCIQGWSIVGKPPTADVTIVGNVGRGFMQGIWFGNAGQGGYDRIIVRNNRMDIALFHGIVLSEARDSEISGNEVHTLPGSRMQNYPFRPVFTWVRATGERNIVCGNKVDLPRVSTDTGRCPPGVGAMAPRKAKGAP